MFLVKYYTVESYIILQRLNELSGISRTSQIGKHVLAVLVLVSDNN